MNEDNVNKCGEEYRNRQRKKRRKCRKEAVIAAFMKTKIP
jgi:hypothetical protein